MPLPRARSLCILEFWGSFHYYRSFVIICTLLQNMKFLLVKKNNDAGACGFVLIYVLYDFNEDEGKVSVIVLFSDFTTSTEQQLYTQF